MKIATWNVNGIRARQAQLEEWVGAERPDVVCLQEIKASADQIPAALCEMEGYWCYWHGEKGYSGVALHVSKALAPERPAFAHPAFDYENRIVTVDLPAVTVASVYVPNGGKDFDAKMRFLNALEEFAGALQDRARPVVICGDLNIARTDMDVHPKERKPRIIGHDLVDTGRALEPDNDQMFTWWAPWRNMRQRNIGWRLDYLLATRSVFEKVSRCTVQRDFGTSDHAPVVAEYEIQSTAQLPSSNSQGTPQSQGPKQLPISF